MVSPQARREAVGILIVERALGVTRACGLMGISRSLYGYRSRRSPALELRSRIAELAALKRRYGYRRIHVLLRREGWSVNHKRTYRLYREQGLMVRKRKRKRIGIAERLVMPAPSAPNQSWSMDYVADALIDGRKLRALTIVDDFTRECLAIEVDTSLPGTRVVAVLERLADLRGLPRRSLWTTVRSSKEESSTPGRTGAVFALPSFGQASRSTTATSRASTDASAMNASTSIGSSRCSTRARRSKPGASNTTPSARTARLMI